MKNILVTGCSGYIGQHLTKLLNKSGQYNVYGLDRYYTEDEDENLKGFLQQDLLNGVDDYLFNMSDMPLQYDAVVHLAAEVRVRDSMENPTHYYMNNILGTVNVLETIQTNNFIFSSTGCANEPNNPYGFSKRVCEDIVTEQCSRNDLPFTVFRFYNVIGTDGYAPTNPDGLMCNLINAMNTGEFNLYGSDYNTFDGTAIRDYIHVNEVCESIVKAIENPSNTLENLGTGIGYSVMQMINTFKRVNSCNFVINDLPRRYGDAEKVVLDNPSSYYKSDYTIDEMLKVK